MCRTSAGWWFDIELVIIVSIQKENDSKLYNCKYRWDRLKYPPSQVEIKNGPKGGGSILSELNCISIIPFWIIPLLNWDDYIKSPADVRRTEFRARQSINATDRVVIAKKWESIVGQALDFELEVASS